MLIQLGSHLIVDSSEILRAERNGFYTDVYLKDRDRHCPMSLNDPRQLIWAQIERAVG